MVTLTPASPDNKSIKKTADSLDELVRSTREFNEVTSRQTEKMIKLTEVILYLTIVMVFGLIVQICLAF